MKEKIKLNVLRLFDNPLSKYLILKRICVLVVLDYLQKSKRGLGLTFVAHFLEAFIKMFFI